MDGFTLNKDSQSQNNSKNMVLGFLKLQYTGFWNQAPGGEHYLLAVVKIEIIDQSSCVHMKLMEKAIADVFADIFIL